MKLNNIHWLLFIICFGCQPEIKESTDKKLPRIAIAGLAIESSTFSPARTTEEAFHAYYGEDVFNYFPFLNARIDYVKNTQKVKGQPPI